MKLSRRKWSRPLMFVLSIFTILSFAAYYKSINPIHLMEQLYQELTTDELFSYTNFQDDQWLLRTPGCFIQRLDPWDPLTTANHYQKFSASPCQTETIDSLITLCDDGYLSVNHETRDELVDQGNNKSFICRLWRMHRKWEDESEHEFRMSKTFIEFSNRTLMSNEYSRVECLVGSDVIYRNYFYRIIKKDEVEHQCQLNERLHAQNHSQCSQGQRLSVLVIGVSRVSRSNFLRHFPRTFDVLANYSQLFDFQGFNKVGADSFQCLVPYLSGLSAVELERNCWDRGVNTPNNCSFLWDQFETAGYRTAFFENVNDPVSFLRHKAQYRKRLGHYGNTPYPYISKSLKNGCYMGKPADQTVLELAFQFQKEFNQVPHFGHFWINGFSRTTALYHADSDLADVISNMEEQGFLNNTLLILMSDHGMSMGDYMESEMGRLDEKLPFLFLKFPPWFEDAHPEAVKHLHINRFRLITAFDVHRTLQSVIKCDFGSVEDPSASRGRAVTLFRSISANRTCNEASIPDPFCGCKQNAIELGLTSSIVLNLTNVLIDHLNAATALHRSACAKYQLDSVMYVRQMFNRAVFLRDKKRRVAKAQEDKYVLAVAVHPGLIKFEATIHHVHVNNTLNVQPDIVRINQLGRHNDCLKINGVIQLICYCT